MTVPRPALRWHGGKWLLAPWIIEHFPEHRVYVEPFGGAASVLMRKPRVYAEVYNDLDDEVVNLFAVLRSDRAADLIDSLRLTPFAKTEFEQSYQPTDDPLERARRLCIRSFMGFGSNGHNAANKTGFRANSNRSGTTPAKDWLNYPDSLAAVAERLAGVIVEHKDAMAVMQQHDGDDVLHYVDPPYVWETRSPKMHRKGCYAHEMTAEQHEALLRGLRSLSGMVVLSGYPHATYDAILGDWMRVERKALADGAKERTEVLWINPLCSERLNAERAQLVMFDGDAA